MTNDLTFILISVIGITSLVIAMILVLHFTKSWVLSIVASFVITEVMFNVTAWITEYSPYLWFVIIFLLPLVHFTALAIMAHTSKPSVSDSSASGKEGE